MLNGSKLTQINTAKELCLHMDRRLTWKKHIFTKRKQLGIKFRDMYWLYGQKFTFKYQS